jgi:hypothetical protein
MTTTCRNAVRSFRTIAHINLRQARAAKRNGLDRLAAHHLTVALENRADANALRRTARPS